MKAAFFIMSCDKNKDVLKHFLLSFNKFVVCDNVKCFVGLNSIDVQLSDNFTQLIAPVSDWKTEVSYQLNIIKNSHKEFTHLIILLDDFIFNKNVDNVLFRELISDDKLGLIKYLRLKKLEDSFFLRFLSKFSKYFYLGSVKCSTIRKNHPYFYSLQSAIWDIEYLIDSVDRSKDIWHFENLKPLNDLHYTVCENIFNYKHIVEKGKWEFYAKRYCEKYIQFFDAGSREAIENNLSNYFINQLKIIKFSLLGYLRLNKVLNFLNIKIY